MTKGNFINKDIKNQKNIINIEKNNVSINVLSNNTLNIPIDDKAIKAIESTISNLKNWGVKNMKFIFSKVTKFLQDSQNKKLHPIDQLKVNHLLDGASKIPAQGDLYEHLRILWAKIIAGEIQKPNSVSLKTINIIKI